MPNGSGPVVVITGASAGVGRATAQRFARDHARIALLARGNDGLEGARRDVEALGGQAVTVQTDVARPDEVERAAEIAEETFGPVDIWINNAMTSVFAEIKDTTPEEYRRVTDVTYLGSVYGAMSALRRMLPRDHGTIVQVGSALAYRAIPLQAAYCGAKHAIQGFTESLRTELYHQKSNVWVTMVQLPALNTPQFGWVRSKLPRKAQPVPPIYQPEVAADAIHWAAHHRRREINVGFSTYQAILGNRIVPGLLDRYLGRSGYNAQQYDGPEDPDRADNLWQAVPGDPGPHGVFGDRSKSGSPELWAETHRSAIAAAALGALVAGAGAVRGIGSLFSGNGEDDEER